jgi:hypothetical protein
MSPMCVALLSWHFRVILSTLACHAALSIASMALSGLARSSTANFSATVCAKTPAVASRTAMPIAACFTVALSI